MRLGQAGVPFCSQLSKGRTSTCNRRLAGLAAADVRRSTYDCGPQRWTAITGIVKGIRPVASSVSCESAAASVPELSAPALRGHRGCAVSSARVRLAGSRRPHSRRGRCSRIAGDRDRLWGSVGPGRCRPALQPATSRSAPRVGIGHPARATWPGFASVHRPGHRPHQLPGAGASYPCRRSRGPRRRRRPTRSAFATQPLVDAHLGHLGRRGPWVFVPASTPAGPSRLVPPMVAFRAQSSCWRTFSVVHVAVS